MAGPLQIQTQQSGMIENMIEYFSLDQSLGLRIFKNHMKREHHHVLLVTHSNACLSLLVPGENLKLTSL